MTCFRSAVAVERKSDQSPVTEADRRAEAVIARVLRDAFPAIPLVAEEAVEAGKTPPKLGERFFLVDPLDGTKEFIAGLDEFTVNIALVERGQPACGVVYAPALGEMFWGSAAGALRAKLAEAGCPGEPVRIHVRPCPGRPLAVASRSHRTAETQAFLESCDPEAVLAVGSSLKFCRLAEGKADLYPCLGRTMAWDTAAGHAVLAAAGGDVTTLDGAPLTYGGRKEGGAIDLANPFFIARGAAKP